VLLSVPRVVAFDTVGSTLDIAHELGARDADAGTLILANAQTAGRGRHGKRWRSESGAGIWLTLVERPRDVAALDVLSVRVGLTLAPALDRFANDMVRLKWPNDLYLGRGKLAGVLVEARWRADAPDWVAIGVGINTRVPDGERAASLQAGTSRAEVLRQAVPAIRAAAHRAGLLDSAELARFVGRDLAAGRECTEPVRGRVRGIDRAGALVVDADGVTTTVRAGSLVLKEDL